MGLWQLLILAVVGAGILAGVAGLLHLLGHRTSEAEKERERRLRLNSVGRICDGTIEQVTGLEKGRPCVLHYSYSVRGVTYAAAQDVSTLGHRVRLEECSEGVPASVKYDPQNPSNSIVVCELWSGLR